MDDFTIHACEQVLRFSSVENWDDLSEAIKNQLSFNMGVLSHGLSLTKDNGYMALVNLREGSMSVKEFHDHVRGVVESHSVQVAQKNIDRPF